MLLWVSGGRRKYTLAVCLRRWSLKRFERGDEISDWG
jgi:hypothetical protein